MRQTLCSVKINPSIIRDLKLMLKWNHSIKLQKEKIIYKYLSTFELSDTCIVFTLFFFFYFDYEYCFM